MDVEIEPFLQPFSNEELQHKTTNIDDDAGLDVDSTHVWGKSRQQSFFDVRVFNPFAQSYGNTSLPQCYPVKMN